MFLLEPGTDMSMELLRKILQKYQTGERSKLKRYRDYFDGNQDILRKSYNDPSKPCNHIVTNYCDNIVCNYAGYLGGKPVTYKSERDIDGIQEVLKYNDVKSKDSDLLRNALIYGRAYELQYIDEDGKARFDVLDTLDGIPVYDNTITRNLLYFIRVYPAGAIDATPEYIIEVLTPYETVRYSSDGTYSVFRPIETEPHPYGQVPVTVFSLNADEVPVFYKIMSLQDAYNTLLSSEVDDFEAFCDAYLVLTGMDADEETIAAMKENRALVIPEGGGAEYLTKSVSDTQIQNMLQNINDTIHKIANSPDFSQESFGVSSGIALRYRLLGFENAAAAIESNMVKALQKRIELICDILHLTGGEEVWRDVEIVVGRNLPVNYDELVALVNSLRGVVSDKTLLSLLPFVQDVDAELDALAEQKAENMELYGFGDPATGESGGGVNEQEER